MAKGGARPGAGRPPGSKSTLNAAKRESLAEKAQKYTEAALKVLVEIAQDPNAAGAARVSAANSLLDRGHGKAIQAVTDVPHDKLPQPFTGWYIERAQPDTPDAD